MTILDNYGWNNFHQQHARQFSNTELSIGRVLSIKGFKYFLITEKGELETELSGKLLYGISNEELPKVGDWVSFMGYDSMGYIIEVFPRMNALARKTPGAKTEKQILAVNIDCALIVQGLDRDFNLMRLERYLFQITACKIRPVVILNKSDLVEDPQWHTNEVQKLQRNCEIRLCSTYTGLGIQSISEQVLEKNKTYILVGSSGVGKSSLLNAIASCNIQKTGHTSETTEKGKHTTTTRDLFRLPNGSLLIDTPGMREFGVTHENARPNDELFPAIEKFSNHCKFSDCRHINEKGCGVIEAAQAGELDREVYESYLKLLKEQKRFEIKIEDKKRMGKQFGKIVREANNFRKKYKG